MPNNLRWTVEEYQAHMRRMLGHLESEALKAQPRPQPPPVRKPDVFLELCASYSLPLPAREVFLIPDRDFRFDYVWLPQRITVEQQGFRDHSTRKGLHRDYEKLNLAQAAGWKVFQFTPKQLASVETIEWLRVQLARVE